MDDFTDRELLEDIHRKLSRFEAFLDEFEPLVRKMIKSPIARMARVGGGSTTKLKTFEEFHSANGH